MRTASIAQRNRSAFCAILLCSIVHTGFAQEFRVDSEVFHGEDKQPIVATLTVFTKGMAYDFQLTDPKEITIFEPARGRFTMLDIARQIRTEVNTQDLLQYSLDLETRAAAESNALLAFAARPQFKTTAVQVNENGQQRMRLTLAGKPLEYVALGQTPPQPEMARIYRNFADWSARLNATRTHSLPPGARLVLNEELAERGLLPLEVTRVISPSNPLAKKQEMKSQHLVNGVLSNKDQNDVAQADDFNAKFKSVSYDQYRNMPAKVALKGQANR